MRPPCACALTLLLTVMLSACGSSPPVSYFTLSAVVPSVKDAPPATYSVAVGSAAIPDAVDRPQLVSRIDANRVAIDDFTRWAEPLRSGIPRVIAENLARLLPGARVSAHPNSSPQDADYHVRLDVQQFESAPGDSVSVEALWTVRPARGGDVLKGRSRVQEAVQGHDVAALLAAHDRALAVVSREIADAVRAAAAGK